MLVLAGAIFVGGLAGITLEEQQLADALIGINAAISPGGIAEFQGEMALPTCLGRRGVHDDAQAGIGAFAQANHGDVGGHPHVFEGHAQTVGMGWKNEIGTIAVVVERGGLQIGGIKTLGIHDRARDVPKNQKLLGRKAQVVAIGGTTEAEDR